MKSYFSLPTDNATQILVMSEMLRLDLESYVDHVNDGLIDELPHHLEGFRGPDMIFAKQLLAKAQQHGVLNEVRMHWGQEINAEVDKIITVRDAPLPSEPVSFQRPVIQSEPSDLADLRILREFTKSLQRVIDGGPSEFSFSITTLDEQTGISKEYVVPEDYSNPQFQQKTLATMLPEARSLYVALSNKGHGPKIREKWSDSLRCLMDTGDLQAARTTQRDAENFIAATEGADTSNVTVLHRRR